MAERTLEERAKFALDDLLNSFIVAEDLDDSQAHARVRALLLELVQEREASRGLRDLDIERERRRHRD